MGSADSDSGGAGGGGGGISSTGFTGTAIGISGESPAAFSGGAGISAFGFLGASSLFFAEEHPATPKRAANRQRVIRARDMAGLLAIGENRGVMARETLLDSCAPGNDAPHSVSWQSADGRIT